MPLISTLGSAASQSYGSLGILPGGSALQTAAAFLQFPAGAAFQYGTGDFTIEMWFYPTDNSSTRILWNQRTSSDRYILVYTNTSRQVLLQIPGNDAYVFTQNQWVLNQWNHVALVRNSNNIRFFLNGFGNTARVLTTNFSNATIIPRLGYSFGAVGFIGNFSNVRVAKSAYYTANFEPALTPFTRTSQGASAVQLLLNFRNAQQLLVDSSSNNITVTNSGTVFSELSPYKVPYVVPPTITVPTATVTPNTFAVSEGSTVTFTVNSTNAANGTYFWSVELQEGATQPTAADFVEGTLTGTFTINNNVGTVSLTPIKDLTTEGPEEFALFVRTESISGAVFGASDLVSIVDTSITPVFTITPASINEGSAGTFAVANVGPNGTYFFTVENVSTTNADFVAASGSFTVSGSSGGIDNGSGSFTITPAADRTTEGAETFRVQIRSGSTAGPVIITSSNVTVNDISLTPAFTSAPGSVNEGATATYSVNNLGPAGTYFFTVENVSTTNSDFVAVSGSFTTSTLNGTGSFSITTVNDYVTEGNETFRLQIRTGSTSGTVILTSGNITLVDTSQTVTATASSSFVQEGDSVQITASSTSTPNGTYYWTILHGTTSSFDFLEDNGSFTISSNSGSFFVSPIDDLINEGDETFQVQIRINSTSGSVIATTGVITVTDGFFGGDTP
jgi:hypothetical protein